MSDPTPITLSMALDALEKAEAEMERLRRGGEASASKRLQLENDELEAEVERLREALEGVLDWAYPMPGFHRSDEIKAAREALGRGEPPPPEPYRPECGRCGSRMRPSGIDSWACHQCGHRTTAIV